ncbi:RmlC-like cupin [Decorospora gaudefroyi]|uniref:RmlC-like cupin n=1 Tax=Decorospora gaudefroyi TaxID=184978 RepID=A0A6A5JX56_9PLEO|nr:RmlC-like cupin [Decorospora gaudefroyi]
MRPPTPPPPQPQPLVLHPRTISQLPPETFPNETTARNVSWKTLFSNDKTATNTFTTGLATCPASTASQGDLKLHRHTHAEMYYVTAGRGVVTIEGQEYGVGEGSLVFIPADAEHGVRNTGVGDLVWLYVFAADGFGEVVYRFSGAKAKL